MSRFPQPCILFQATMFESIQHTNKMAVIVQIPSQWVGAGPAPTWARFVDGCCRRLDLAWISGHCTFLTRSLTFLWSLACKLMWIVIGEHDFAAQSWDGSSLVAPPFCDLVRRDYLSWTNFCRTTWCKTYFYMNSC